MLDPVAARRALSARLLRCPGCGERLRPWGRARVRRVRDTDGVVELAPDRARCTGCAATHVLMAATVVPRSGYGARIVAAALLAAAGGVGHRRIAADLALPVGTARDWCRRAHRGAATLTASVARIAQQLGAAVRPEDAPMPTALAEALNVAGAVAAALADVLEAAARPQATVGASGVGYLRELATAHLHGLARHLRLAAIPADAADAATPLGLLTVVTGGLLPAPAR